jgi:hypothetical protein
MHEIGNRRPFSGRWRLMDSMPRLLLRRCRRFRRRLSMLGNPIRRDRQRQRQR